MLPENTFGHDLDPDYLIGDNYGYSNDGEIIQISVKNTELQQKIKKGLEEDQIAQQVIMLWNQVYFRFLLTKQLT